MIAQLQGVLVDKGLDRVVIEVGGVGLLVHVPLSTLSSLPPVGQHTKLLTYLLVREDALALYGFATFDEKQTFELCLAISGIGPKLALAVLSGLGPVELADAVARGDLARLARIPGVGKKTSERLAMELRDKLPRVVSASDGRSPVKPGATRDEGKSGPHDHAKRDVVSALTNLGYKAVDAERVTDRALTDLATPEAPLPALETILRHALRALQKD